EIVSRASPTVLSPVADQSARDATVRAVDDIESSAGRQSRSDSLAAANEGVARSNQESAELDDFVSLLPALDLFDVVEADDEIQFDIVAFLGLHFAQG